MKSEIWLFCRPERDGFFPSGEEELNYVSCETEKKDTKWKKNKRRIKPILHREKNGEGKSYERGLKHWKHSHNVSYGHSAEKRTQEEVIGGPRFSTEWARTVVWDSITIEFLA